MIVTAEGHAIPTKYPMTLDKLKRFMEFETVLRDCHWAIVCRRCASFVAGDNPTGSSRISVHCRCAEYLFDAGAS